MRFSQDTPPNTHLIRRYDDDSIWVGDTRYATSVIVTADTVLPWSARDVEALGTAEMDAVLALKPELILLATGTSQRFPAPPVLYHALTRQVGIEVMNLGGACRTYNVLVGDGRRVALAALLG